MFEKKEGGEVFFSDDRIVKLGRQDLSLLKRKAGSNRRRRIRFCSHKDVNDALHEMFIVLKKDVYIRPHKHLNKSESFHVIEGAADIVVFDEAGKITEVFPMGDYSSAKSFYYRIAEPNYHSLLINSEFLVYHEITNGPFKKTDTIFAPWAPEEDDNAKVKIFMKDLREAVQNSTGNPK